MNLAKELSFGHRRLIKQSSMNHSKILLYRVRHRQRSWTVAMMKYAHKVNLASSWWLTEPRWKKKPKVQRGYTFCRRGCWWSCNVRFQVLFLFSCLSFFPLLLLRQPLRPQPASTAASAAHCCQGHVLKINLWWFQSQAPNIPGLSLPKAVVLYFKDLTPWGSLFKMQSPKHTPRRIWCHGFWVVPRNLYFQHVPSVFLLQVPQELHWEKLACVKKWF